MPEICVGWIDPCAPGLQSIIAASDAFYDGLYPAESNHLEAIDDLQKANVLLAGGRCQGELVAIGAAKLMQNGDGCAEIKRVFVVPEFRGRGLSARLMEFLENELRRRGVELVRLETGVRQPEAIGLYNKLGYRERGPFGAYQPDPLSVFMEKRLFVHDDSQ